MLLKRETFIIIGQLICIVLLSLLFSSTSLSPLNNSGIEGLTPYASISDTTLAYDDTTAVNMMSPDTSSEYKKVGGFSGYGVFSSPTAKPQIIDIFSQAKGDINCENLGFSNSMGPICLDDNMKRMLTTRGANATGNV